MEYSGERNSGEFNSTGWITPGSSRLTVTCSQQIQVISTSSTPPPSVQVKGRSSSTGVSESQDSFFTNQVNQPVVAVPMPMTQPQIQQSIELLQKMPANADPFEYMKQLKITIVKNTAEDALAKKLMKRHITEATFNKSKQQKYIPPFKLLPLNGRKSSSKSAPGTPLFAARQESMESPQQLKLLSPCPNLVESESAVRKFMGKDYLSNIEAAFIQLTAAVDFANNLASKTVPDTFLTLRALCKKTLELTEAGKYNLTPKHQEVIVRAAAKITQLFEEFSGDSKESGVPDLVERLVNCLMEVGSDCMVGLVRGNSVHAVFGAMKSIKIRNLIFQTLVEALMGSFNRIYRVTYATKGEDAVMDFDEISGLFRLFQLIEFIILTTSKNPWMEDSQVKKLVSMENVCLRCVPFANIQIFMARVAAYAKRFEKK